MVYLGTPAETELIRALMRSIFSTVSAKIGRTAPPGCSAEFLFAKQGTRLSTSLQERQSFGASRAVLMAMQVFLSLTQNRHQKDAVSVAPQHYRPSWCCPAGSERSWWMRSTSNNGNACERLVPPASAKSRQSTIVHRLAHNPCRLCVVASIGYPILCIS